ncbi:hypothetical protein E5720_16355 [Rhodococcus sp. PAMC28707]|nr:hypothetical protein E5769_19165 [Rhodococcus sp. PAMC28705]QCB59834.1 hypothetical protein E5720_16355 [Rhodococcus sp. PAMC28707]
MGDRPRDFGQWTRLELGSTEMSPTSMSRSRRSFSAEFKDELCREVIELSKPISEVAKVYGVGDDSLRRWLAKYRDTHGGSVDSELTLTERARLNQLEREVRELRSEAAFLKKAALESKGQRNNAVEGGCGCRRSAGRECRIRRRWSCGGGGDPANRSASYPADYASRRDLSSRY